MLYNILTCRGFVVGLRFAWYGLVSCNSLWICCSLTICCRFVVQHVVQCAVQRAVRQIEANEIRALAISRLQVYSETCLQNCFMRMLYVICCVVELANIIHGGLKSKPLNFCLILIKHWPILYAFLLAHWAWNLQWSEHYRSYHTLSNIGLENLSIFLHFLMKLWQKKLEDLLSGPACTLTENVVVGRVVAV